MPLLPLDSNVTSTGAIKVMDGYRNAKGKKEQLGFQAFFVPTYAARATARCSRSSPRWTNPVLDLTAYHGDLGVDSGIPQSVYQLDKTQHEGVQGRQGQAARENLKPGETMKLPNGAGSITFDKGIKEWASFQVTQQPGSGWALAGADRRHLRPRRLPVHPAPPGLGAGGDAAPTASPSSRWPGLGRSESAKVPEELGDLAGILYDQAPGAPDARPTPRSRHRPDADTPNRRTCRRG